MTDMAGSVALRAAPGSGCALQDHVWPLAPNDLGRTPATSRRARPERRILLSRSGARRRPRSVAPGDEVHAFPPEHRLGAAGRRDDGRPIQVQDEAEPVGPAPATKPLGVLVHVRLRVVQVLGEAAPIAGCTLARYTKP